MNWFDRFIRYGLIGVVVVLGVPFVIALLPFAVIGWCAERVKPRIGQGVDWVVDRM
jgi:hypothetical protein